MFATQTGYQGALTFCSSIFFMADSVLSGWMMILCSLKSHVISLGQPVDEFAGGNLLEADRVRHGCPGVLGVAAELEGPGEVERGRGPRLDLLVGVVLSQGQSVKSVGRWMNRESIIEVVNQIQVRTARAEIMELTPLRAAFAASFALAEPALGFAPPNHIKNQLSPLTNSETRKSCCSCDACQEWQRQCRERENHAGFGFMYLSLREEPLLRIVEFASSKNSKS